jgi:hypothetical protein
MSAIACPPEASSLGLPDLQSMVRELKHALDHQVSDIKFACIELP